MLPQHCLGKEVALCEVGMGASRIPGEALRPKARETARRSLEPTEAPLIQATQEGPGSPCREHLGNYIRSFKTHLLYAGRALGTTVGTRQSDGDPDKDNGMKSNGQATVSHSRSGQPLTEETGDITALVTCGQG